MSNKKEIQVIITKDGKYNLYDYQSEMELEKTIVEHSAEIFGKNTLYIPKIKIKSKAGIGTIPDGYVIDFDKKRLYILEVELIKHRLRHISHQIHDFIDALHNERTGEELLEEFYNKLPLSKKIEKKDLKFILSNQSIIILIDNLGDSIEEVNCLLELINSLSERAEVKVIPFQTYIKGSGFSQDHIHSFKSFTKEELENESKKWTFKWETVPAEKHINKLNENSKVIFEELRRKICNISPDIKEVHRTTWTTFQISKLGNFCTIKFPKGNLEIHIKVNKNKFIDKNKITKDIKRSPSWTFDKVFMVKSQKDINYAISLIKQAYECVCESKK